MVDFKLPMWDNGRVGFCKPVQPASVHQRLRAWTCLHFQQLLLFSSSKYPVSPFPKHVHGQIGLLLIVIGLIFLHSAEMFPPSAFHLQMLDYSYFILLKLEFVFLLPVTPNLLTSHNTLLDISLHSREKKSSSTHQNIDTSFPNQETLTSHLYKPTHSEQTPQ